MVRDRPDALGDLVVVAGRPSGPMFLFQLSEICHFAPPP